MTYIIDMKKILLILLVLLNFSINSYCLDFSAEINSDTAVNIAQSNNTDPQAESYRNHAYRKLEEAKSMLSKNRFDEAQAMLKEARDSFRISLSFKEDRKLRADSDRELFALSEKIIRLKAAILIETVRNNIKTARDYYERGKYNEAEILLTKSMEIWDTVNSADNEEIHYHLKLVKTAKNLRSGRVFSESDPLHVKMIQVINLARSDYETAKRLAAGGKKEQAAGYLQSAEEKLLHVTKPFPLNQEAGILSLEIQKIKDPENFKQLFSEKFESAKKGLIINPSESHSF